VYLLMQMMALYRPRLVIVEAGNSFGLLGRYLAEHGLTGNSITLSPAAEVILPPFADAMKLLNDPQRRPSDIRAEDIIRAELEDDALPTDDEEDLTRDLLGEMEIAARIMITGGDEREDARLTRPDRLVIRKAILQATEAVHAVGRDQVLTEDVVAAFNRLAQDPLLPELRRLRAQEMGDALELFCSGLAGRFFNRPGEPWPDADLALLDMGLLAREGYEDQLTVAFLGMMNRINDRVERCQYDARQTLVVADEGHLITTSALLAPYVVKITKMWRKLGAWLWIATQNLEDFPDASKRMLNMMEWWLCLVMPKEEVDQIARFRKLSDEQRTLLLSAHKEPGHYVEGVVLSDTVQALFRSVVPPLCLALAMTEPEEKAERARLMREHRCSELVAARIVARRIEEGRAT
jgi:conjugative transfer ATPase